MKIKSKSLKGNIPVEIKTQFQLSSNKITGIVGDELTFTIQCLFDVDGKWTPGLSFNKTFQVQIIDEITHEVVKSIHCQFQNGLSVVKFVLPKQGNFVFTVNESFIKLKQKIVCTGLFSEISGNNKCKVGEILTIRDVFPLGLKINQGNRIFITTPSENKYEHESDFEDGVCEVTLDFPYTGKYFINSSNCWNRLEVTVER